MLSVQSLQARYGKIQALKDIDLTVGAGEFVAILGPNGAGKSTLIKAIFGLMDAESGTIIFEDRRIENLSSAGRIRLGMSIIPEARQLFPAMTVRENLILGAYARLRSFVVPDLDANLEQVFDLFPRLRERQHQLAGTLSGGEAQMAAIGRAVMSNPRLLLCDEPSLGLAPMMVRDMLAALSRLRDSGVTILLADQNAQAALRIADRGYILDTGRIVAGGTSDALQRDRSLMTAYLGTGIEGAA